MIGQTVSHYRVLQRLGSGGMGVVYAAEDTLLGRRVALKFPGGIEAAPPQLVRRFMREAQSASSLNHGNICKIFEVGEHEGRPFLAMELIEGITLRERIGGRPLPLQTMLDLAVQIADALDEAHMAGIVHRDIKPANIMITKRGQAKIMDFGLAKLQPPVPGEVSLSAPTLVLEQPLTMDGAAVGTVAYMSPEQARGEAIDGRSDLFAFGVVLYEMATGHAAFGGSTQAVVFDAILNRAPTPPAALNPQVPPELQRIIGKAIAKDRHARYQTAADLRADLQLLARQFDSGGHVAPHAAVVSSGPPGLDTAVAAEPMKRSRWARRRVTAAAAVLMATAAAVPIWRVTHREAVPVLTDKDTILLADFENRTGDTVFDGTLRQGLAVQLQQSPFLLLFPDARMRQILPLMGHSPDETVTRDVAREVCQRQGVKAFIAGSIARFDQHYSITLEAVNSQTGESIALTQVEADAKDQILKALSRASTELRRKLGESLSSLERFDAPLELTTTSLDALKAVSRGYQETLKGRFSEAMAFYQRAVELDSNFAYAYAALSTLYYNTEQPGLAAEFATKAFLLRDHVSEIEKLQISFFYYVFVTGDWLKAIERMQVYQQNYPRDFRSFSYLATSLATVGRFEEAAIAGREALRLNPNASAIYFTLGQVEVRRGRFDDARQVFSRALEQKMDTMDHHSQLFWVAAIQNDLAAMEQHRKWAQGTPDEDVIVQMQSAVAAFAGRWQRARDLTRRAMAEADRRKAHEIALRYAVSHALQAAALERCGDLNDIAPDPIVLRRDPEALAGAALALTMCRFDEKARSALRELTETYPEHTLVKRLWLPVIEAAAALERRDATAAVALLDGVVRFESVAEFWPQYIRGTAFLEGNRAADAAAEFKKILDHRGQAAFSVLYPLASLGLARTAAIQHDTAATRSAYDEFLRMWKDADSDLPALVKARYERGALH
jgi:tetratricopeptide (TPR) repeat protein